MSTAFKIQYRLLPSRKTIGPLCNSCSTAYKNAEQKHTTFGLLWINSLGFTGTIEAHNGELRELCEPKALGAMYCVKQHTK